MNSHIKATKPIIPIQLARDPSTSAEGNFYFLEYLEYKLFRFNVDSAIQFDRDDNLVLDCYQQTSERIQEICGLLEHLYPKLYLHVSRQLKVEFRNEVIICDTFRGFCRALFKPGINWPRILALFAFAGAVAIDCIKDRRAEFTKTVVYCMKAFIEDNLASWISEQGGWVSIENNSPTILR